MPEAKIEKRICYISDRPMGVGLPSSTVHTFTGESGWFAADENGAAAYPYLMNNSIAWIEERLVYEPGGWEPVDLDKHLEGRPTVGEESWDSLMESVPTIMAPISDLIAQLLARQQYLCAYSTREGDGRTCDCKYNPLPGIIPSRGEMTGCPELRQAIRALVTLT